MDDNQYVDSVTVTQIRIADQIYSIQEDGETDMLDIPSVQRLAREKEYDELVYFLETADKERYIDYITKDTLIFP